MKSLSILLILCTICVGQPTKVGPIYNNNIYCIVRSERKPVYNHGVVVESNNKEIKIVTVGDLFKDKNENAEVFFPIDKIELKGKCIKHNFSLALLSFENKNKLKFNKVEFANPNPLYLWANVVYYYQLGRTEEPYLSMISTVIVTHRRYRYPTAFTVDENDLPLLHGGGFVVDSHNRIISTVSFLSWTAGTWPEINGINGEKIEQFIKSK